MIAIINRGGKADGVCKYTIGINQRVVAEFEHSRPDGLARCLRLAADAVERQELADMVKVCADVWGKSSHNTTNR